jgi:hypothetical protein
VRYVEKLILRSLESVVLMPHLDLEGDGFMYGFKTTSDDDRLVGHSSPQQRSPAPFASAVCNFFLDGPLRRALVSSEPNNDDPGQLKRLSERQIATTIPKPPLRFPLNTFKFNIRNPSSVVRPAAQVQS